jgi:ParB-like chromosome segregation protein Spo0J
VFGARCLEACKRLGWRTIPVRHADGMSDEELRALEPDENTERLDLDSYDERKQRLAEIRQIEADLRREAAEKKAAGEFQPDSGPNSVGRPRTADSQRQVAEVTG